MQLTSVWIGEKTRKLKEDWTCEPVQNLTCYHGSKHIYWYFRCLKNAGRVKNIRRKKYWINQSVKYNKRTFRGNK